MTISKLSRIYGAVVFLSFLLGLYPSVYPASFQQPIIIDHTCTDINIIPPEWILEAKDLLRMAYWHASHGKQIIRGMNVLDNDSLYSWNEDGSGGALALHSIEIQIILGYPDFDDWEAEVRTDLENGESDKNVIMLAWSYQLWYATEAEINTTLSLMDGLEDDYPDITFIYMTGPLDGLGAAGNVRARNNQIRDYCNTNGKILYDFADIESWDPDWTSFVDKFPDEDCNYDSDIPPDEVQDANWADEWLAANPGSDLDVEVGQCAVCPHSQQLNCMLKSRAFWWMMARLAGWPGPEGSPLNAVISASPTSGDVPLDVSFTGTATGGTPPYSFSWDFGDGNSSTVQNPNHTYSYTGDYSATLTVTDNVSDQSTDSITINVSTQPHDVTTPDTPSGPSSGDVNTSYSFSTGGATCSEGHSVEYRFDWGDGNVSGWSTSTSASYAWASAGTYTVTARARCASDTTIRSSWYTGISVVVTASHTVTSPNTPSGPSSGDLNTSYSFSTGGATCSEGHGVEYRFDWGDGTTSVWSTSTSASHSWTSAGTYTVRARARCTDDTSILSSWSTGIVVVIAVPHTVNTPNTPSGPTSGFTNTSYSYSTGGTVCSQGHDVLYRFDWGDGTTSPWSTLTSVSHSWASTGTYTVSARARCITDPSIVSSWSTGINVSISIIVQHEVSIPNTPSGPSAGPINVSGSFFTGGASCSEGHSVEYRFDWGDGSYSDWSSSTSASHSWADAGTYSVKAQARCSVNNAVTSSWSAGKSVSISAPQHAVSNPSTPTGPSSGLPDVVYTYDTGSSACSLGHDVEYRFDWGDGTYSVWSSSTSASRSWSGTGAYSIRAQSRCSVDTGIVSGWSNGLTLQITQDTATFDLSLSSATSAAVPGEGGTINPPDGNYTYPSGSTVQLIASANQNYRFSKWTGDVNSAEAFRDDISVTLDQNKALTANFFTRCGDVNGDLQLSPGDAQQAFDIYLGRINNPTEAQRENADVNCDGTKTNPLVTPGDAHAIFLEFLEIEELPGDCSCESRADDVTQASVQRSTRIDNTLRIDNLIGMPGQQILVPVIIDKPFNIKSFGFDVVFPSEHMNFVGVARTELTSDFVQMDAFQITEGVVRAGGYRNEPISHLSSGTLLILIFDIKASSPDGSLILITNPVDDLEGTQIVPGRIFVKGSLEQIPEKVSRDRNNIKK